MVPFAIERWHAIVKFRDMHGLCELLAEASHIWVASRSLVANRIRVEARPDRKVHLAVEIFEGYLLEHFPGGIAL
jgi:hypothetical protein